MPTEQRQNPFQNNKEERGIDTSITMALIERLNTTSTLARSGLVAFLLVSQCPPPCIAFVIAPANGGGIVGTTHAQQPLQRPSLRRLWAAVPDKRQEHNKNYDNNTMMVESNTNSIDEDDGMEDTKLLKQIKKQQLVDLCQQMNLSTTGTKEEMLQRLRAHAQATIQAEKTRRLARVQQVEEGDDNPKVRHEIVSSSSPFGEEDDDEDDDDDDFFFYHAPEMVNVSTSTTNDDTPNTTNQKKKPYLSQASVTAPPPPDHVQPNAQGERVVKVYSTTDENDLTGIAASQPGLTAMSSDTLSTASSSSSSSQQQPWDPQNNQRATATREEEKAKEDIIELVQTLLSMTSLPAFQFDDEDDEDSPMQSSSSTSPSSSFVGFDPTKVPTDVLTASSQALRTGRGAILQDVLRQFELQAIGQDGMHGDNTDNGGGHYREVAKVRAFLEGYRRAEVRRIARGTTAMLLDKLVLEGVEGLDMTLATMTRSSDDTSEYGGELNDSLIEFLNDVIRQQEKKVDKLVAERLDASEKRLKGSSNMQNDANLPGDHDDDALDNLWNVTTTEDGQRLESLDPNDPRVQAALADELAKQDIAETLSMESSKNKKPETAPEQLLLLLTLLRERIKTEAVFVPDEKGRNLRLLAYCLQLTSDNERRQLMNKELGNALDRIDSFIELVSSSVEYAQSASYQLQPAKTKRPLNVRELQQILKLAQEFHAQQKRRASGVK